MRRTTLLEHVDHVLEVFDVAALVRRQRDAVGVFLRMMLIAASWPSNRLAAVTKRSGVDSVDGALAAKWRAWVVMGKSVESLSRL
jgi:hypothetical protein